MSNCGCYLPNWSNTCAALWSSPWVNLLSPCTVLLNCLQFVAIFFFGFFFFFFSFISPFLSFFLHPPALESAHLNGWMQRSRCGFTWLIPPQHHCDFCWNTHKSYTVLLPYFKLVLTCWPLQAPGYFHFQTLSLQRSFKCFIFNYFPFPHIILIAFPVSISYCFLCFLLFAKLSNLGASVIFISLLFTSEWLMIILKARVFTPNH